MLSKLAKALRGFPSRPDDFRDFELGTFNPKQADGGAQMHFYCADAAGHAVVELKLRGNGCKGVGEIESVALRIPIQAAAVDNFIQQLTAIGKTIGASAFLKQATSNLGFGPDSQCPAKRAGSRGTCARHVPGVSMIDFRRACKFVRLSLMLSVFLTASACVHGQDIEPPRVESERAEPKSLEIKNVNLLARRDRHGKVSYAEVKAFREMQTLRLGPSNKFDVTCQVVGGWDVLTDDYFLWTSVDFLVAPVTRAYEQMDDNTLASSVGWGQLSEMQDLNGTAIYFLRPGETRPVVVKGLNLSTVLSAFPVGNAGELWPWLVRVRVHIQDHSGKQIAIAERMVRLSPSSARKSGHYRDPLPNR